MHDLINILVALPNVFWYAVGTVIVVEVMYLISLYNDYVIKYNSENK